MSEQARREWEQLPGESRAAFAAFTLYRLLPATERTILKAWKASKPQRANHTLSQARSYEQLSSSWDWSERAQAWDAWLVREAEMSALKKEEERYQGLLSDALELRFKKLELGKRVLKRVNELLDVPHVEVQTVRNEDGAFVTIKPHRWNAGDIARLASSGVELIASATEDIKDAFSEKVADRQRGTGEAPPANIADVITLLQHANAIIDAGERRDPPTSAQPAPDATQAVPGADSGSAGDAPGSGEGGIPP